jgi:hypothetical protein
MKGSHLFWLSRSKGMTVDIWIRDYSPPRCFQKKISGRGKHNVANLGTLPIRYDIERCMEHDDNGGQHRFYSD